MQRDAVVGVHNVDWLHRLGSRLVLDETMTLLDLLDQQSSFENFHARNPQVYRELETMAAQMVARGRKKIGVKMLFEVLRWNYYLNTTGDDFKLNNNYAPAYARLLLKNHPDWHGLFELRMAKSDY